MSGTIGYEELRAGTVRQVAQLMAAAAITAPKSGGQLFLAGKPGFMETVIADDAATRKELAAWMRARGGERRERIWFRDADAAEAVAVGRLQSSIVKPETSRRSSGKASRRSSVVGECSSSVAAHRFAHSDNGYKRNQGPAGNSPIWL